MSKIKAGAFYHWLGINNPHMALPAGVTVHETYDVAETPRVPSAIEHGQVSKPKKKGFWARLFG
ncbi:Putative uncharacterized protein [Limosilactobacillus fermentum CECT 5716]|nr:Putative uncharacterized protein [Limosilactobacillus fermentum CECT 5716]